MNYGVTETGFVPKRLTDVLESLRKRFRDQFGQIAVDDDSVPGQIIGIIGERLALLWEGQEKSYQSSFRSTAYGVSLDGTAQLVGLVRLEATPSIVSCLMTSDNPSGSVPVPDTAQGRVQTTDEIFQIRDASAIVNTSAGRVKIKVTSALTSTTYDVTLETVTYSFTTPASPAQTKGDIVDGLLNEINTTQPAGVVPVLATKTDGADPELIVDVVDGLNNILMSVGANLSLDEVSSFALFDALETGSVAVPVNTFINIVGSIPNVTAFDNTIPGIRGTDVETDTELRQRMETDLNVVGSGTVDAIRARILQNVDNVISVSVVENTETVTVDGIPPKAFETIVQGGLEQDIADEIWQVKPAGIQAFGDVIKDVTDSVGRVHQVGFSKATEIWLWIKGTITLLDNGTFPEDGFTQISNNLIEFLETFNIGDDVIFQELYCPIYNVPGIASVDFKIARTAIDTARPAYPGGFQDTNIIVSPKEFVTLTADRGVYGLGVEFTT